MIENEEKISKDKNKSSYDFELEKIKGLIKESGARKVGLQFPEGFKMLATDIAAEISKESDAEVIISGESCYGACDVDEKLGSIVDVLFHFGHSEWAKENISWGSKAFFQKKVFFIEVRSNVDVKPVVEKAVKEIKGETVALVATVQHVHALEEIKALLSRFGKKQAVIGKRSNKMKTRIKYDGQVLGCDFSSAMVSCDEILFIGSGSFHPTGLALYTGKRVIAADPFTTQINIFKPDELRRKRYMRIERALDAKSFGIIVGMKNGQFRKNEAISLRRKAMEKGLDAYLITMDEIREEKLLGFKVDAFVNTACPRLAENFVSFKKPVLTAQEFEVVIEERDWEDIFTLSF